MGLPLLWAMLGRTGQHGLRSTTLLLLVWHPGPLSILVLLWELLWDPPLEQVSGSEPGFGFKALLDGLRAVGMELLQQLGWVWFDSSFLKDRIETEPTLGKFRGNQNVALSTCLVPKVSGSSLGRNGTSFLLGKHELSVC